MKGTMRMVMQIGIGLLSFGLLCCAGKERERELVRTFDGKSTVTIQTIAGNCVVTRATGKAVEVHLTYAYRPAGAFEPVFSEEGDQLVIKENMRRGSNFGHSTWTLAVPANTAVHFNSASGSFGLSGLESNVTVRTASGGIEVRDASGTFTLHTASGTVSARGVELRGSSSFSSASGNTSVALAKTAAFDLDVSSVTGDARLNYNGSPFQGRYEFETMKSKGTIQSPVPFEREEELVRDGDTYLVKSFHKGGDVPRIRIHSATSSVVLVER